MKWLPWVITVVVSVAAYLGGRYLTPPEVRVETKTEWRDRVIERRVEVAGATVEKIRVVTRTVWATPDAGSVIREQEVEGSRAQVLAVTGSSRDETRIGSASTITTPVPPRWSVGVQFGAAWQRPWLELTGPLVVGLDVRLRLAGPLWVGCWVSTHGAAGLSLSVTW